MLVVCFQMLNKSFSHLTHFLETVMNFLNTHNHLLFAVRIYPSNQRAKEREPQSIYPPWCGWCDVKWKSCANEILFQFLFRYFFFCFALFSFSFHCISYSGSRTETYAVIYTQKSKKKYENKLTALMIRQTQKKF